VGTFVEHAHRLWGLLVGLTTIVLMVHLWMVDGRRWVRGLSLGIVLAVVFQGVLGGTRVTESSVMLAMVHGVTAQALFATLVVTAMATGRAWRDAGPPVAAPSVAADRTLTTVLVVVVLVQIVLGTFYRHLQPVPDAPRGALMGVLHGHSFVGSLIVVLMVLFCGVRAWGLYPTRPVIGRIGKMLVHTMGLQVMLGFVSFVLVPKGVREPDDAITLVEVVFTTAHQVTGAILLALAVALFVWERRLLKPGQ
jgi:cytochrome c oxidase assembly protein subunit 15